jgi:hypothetical protein
MMPIPASVDFDQTPVSKADGTTDHRVVHPDSGCQRPDINRPGTFDPGMMGMKG